MKQKELLDKVEIINCVQYDQSMQIAYEFVEQLIGNSSFAYFKLSFKYLKMKIKIIFQLSFLKEYHNKF